MDAKVVRHISLNDGRRPKFSLCVMLFVKKIHHVICHNVVSSLWAFDNQKHTRREKSVRLFERIEIVENGVSVLRCARLQLYTGQINQRTGGTQTDRRIRNPFETKMTASPKELQPTKIEKKMPPYKQQKQQRNGKMWQHKYKQGKRKQFISFSIWSRPTVNTMWIIVKCGHYSWSPHTCKETIRKCVQGGP